MDGFLIGWTPRGVGVSYNVLLGIDALYKRSVIVRNCASRSDVAIGKNLRLANEWCGVLTLR